MKLTFAFALILVTGCSLDDAEPICETGATRACACETGETGAQACVEDGFAWGECKCEDNEGGNAGTGGGGGGTNATCELHSDCTDGLACVVGSCADAVILGPDQPCGEPGTVCADGYRCLLYSGAKICIN